MVGEHPITTAKSKLNALKNNAPKPLQDVPPWVWVAVIGLVVATIATVAILSMRDRATQ